MRRASITALLLGAVALARAEPARAYEAEVDASVSAQYYSLRSPYGDPVLRRRRYTQMLSLGVYDIEGDPGPFGPELMFRARMRMDSDFGVEGAEHSPTRGTRYVPGLEPAPLDLMYAYLEGRQYLGGYLGFRVGRQYVGDVLGWWSFDGALLRLTTPAYFEVEAYGGFEQRGGLPMLSTQRFEADGVWRGDRSELESDQYPSFLQQERLAPAYGFAIATTGVKWLSTRLSYRKVINRDTVYISPFADPGGGLGVVGGDRVSTERVGQALTLSDAELGAVSGSAVYDVYNQLVSEYRGSIDWYATDQLSLGAEYEYFLPTFDADSIFNWFSHHGMTTALGRVSLALSRRFDAGLSGGVKWFETEGDPDSYAESQLGGVTPERDTARLLDLLGTASARYRWADGSVALGGFGEVGERGHRTGGDVTTRQAFAGGFYDTLVVLSLYDWEDGLRPERGATSFSYVLGGGVRPVDATRLGLEWEHSMNRLVGQRYRLLATLELSVLR